jgi:type II secretory pathway pseudopilin PulG
MDPQTISIIAASAIGILSPYLAKAGEAAAKITGEDIYTALKTHFSKKPTAKAALADLEKTPDDPDFQAAVRAQLKKVLAEDEQFAAQLQHLLQEAGKTEAGAAIIRQTAGDNARQFGQVFGNITFGQD